MSDDIYELYAIAYAEVERNAGENFYAGDPHNAPMPLKYYTWIARNAHRTVAIDTGFDARGAALRKRRLLRPIPEALAALGIVHEEVKDVVITHMHYDHAGNHDLFPGARFHLQDQEMQFATGRCMCHAAVNHAYEVEDVVQMVRRVYAGQVCFHDGDHPLFPGIRLVHMGGHARGLQSLVVNTKRGPVVIASDVAHHYRHLQENRIFSIVDSVPQAFEAISRLKAIEPDLTRIVPGHDPLVASLYPGLSPQTEGWIMRLDEMPKPF